MLLSNKWQEPSDINGFSRARSLLLDSEGKSLRTCQNTFAHWPMDRWVVDLTGIMGRWVGLIGSKGLIEVDVLMAHGLTCRTGESGHRDLRNGAEMLLHGNLD